MRSYNEWLVEQEGGTTLENCTLMLNGTKLMVECGEDNSFDLELDEEQAADLQEKMSSCSAANDSGDEEGGEEGGMEDMGGDDMAGGPPPQMGGMGGMGGGMGEAKFCKKCKKAKCACPKLNEAKMNFGKVCKKCKKMKCCCKKKCNK